MLPLIPLAVELAQYAPTLLRFFGAGEGSTAVAQKVVDLAQTVTGSKSPEEALQAMREDRAAQAAFRLRALELDATLDQAYLDDRQSARARDIEIVRAGKTNTRGDVMVALAAFGLVACLIVLTVFRGSIPGEVVGLISTIASLFGVCLRDAYQFEFGSSRGSRDKDQLLASRPAA